MKDVQQIDVSDEYIAMTIPWTPTVSGVDKAMALLLSLPPDEMAGVLRYLPPDLIAAIMNEMHKNVPSEPDTRETVLEEAQHLLNYDTGHKDHSVKPDIIFAAASTSASTQPPSPPAWLSFIDPTQLVTLLSDDHAPAIAALLALLAAEQVEAVLSALPPTRQQAVRQHLARMSRPSAATSARIVARLQRRIATLPTPESATTATVTIPISAAARSATPPVGHAAFSFDTLALLDNAAMQRLLRGVLWRDLTAATCGASDKVRSHVLENLPERAASELRTELLRAAPIPRLITEAQRRIIVLLHLLARNGEVMLAEGLIAPA